MSVWQNIFFFPVHFSPTLLAFIVMCRFAAAITSSTHSLHWLKVKLIAIIKKGFKMLLLINDANAILLFGA